VFHIGPQIVNVLPEKPAAECSEQEFFSLPAPTVSDVKPETQSVKRRGLPTFLQEELKVLFLGLLGAFGGRKIGAWHVSNRFEEQIDARIARNRVRLGAFLGLS